MSNDIVYINTRRKQTSYHFAYSTRGPVIFYIHISDFYNRTFESRGSGGLSLSSRHNKIKEEFLNGKELTLEVDEFAVTPKVDPKEELKCFDKTKPAKLTIYVEQPIANSRQITASIGHTFIGLEQNGIIRNLGFYPDTPAASIIANQDSEIHDNSGSKFDVSISTTVTSTQLTQIINYINNYPDTYFLNTFNCSDFGIKIGNMAGLNLPSTKGKYTLSIFTFEGRNPADLGEDIRNIPKNENVNIDEKGGNAPSRKGGC